MALATVRAERTSDFHDSMGVNTHINWTGNSMSWSNTPMVVASLDYLGIDHIRDATPFKGWTLPIYERLADAGYAFTIPVDFASFNRTGSWLETLDRVNDLTASRPGAVAAIEGPNEINVWPLHHGGRNTGSDLALGRDLQKMLWDQVHADPLLRGVDVLNLSVGGLSVQQAAPLGNMDTVSDAGVWHTYFGQGDQPRANLAYGVAAAKRLNPADPVVLTETGYYTAIDDMAWGGGGVSEAVQAKLTLNIFFDAMDLGAERAFLYELLDNNRDLRAADNIEASFGLFRGDGSPKPVATAIRNLVAILDDASPAASGFATRSLAYDLLGLPANARSMLLEKADGTFDLAVWAEPDIWNQATRSAINVAPTQVTLELAAAAASIMAFDPLLGSAAVGGTSNADRFTFALSDHPVIIEIKGAAPVLPPAMPTPTSPPAAPPTGLIGTQSVGVGTDTLVLRIAEDAYKGDALFSVSVDGVAVGGALTAHASRAAGQFENVEVKGDWAPGRHTVEVRLLNDLWDGTPATDRNLHLLGASYDGGAVTGVKVGSVVGLTGFTVTDVTALAKVPAPTPPAIAPASHDTQSFGVGPDKLVLRMSATAQDGDARFRAAVDGKVIGGVITVDAQRGQGDFEIIELRGDWRVGKHAVAVNFLNEVPGRALFVDGVSYDGANVASAPLGALHPRIAFSVLDATPPGTDYMLHG